MGSGWAMRGGGVGRPVDWRECASHPRLPRCARQELDESGWKQVHGDVFCAPPALGLFCSLVGTGSQLGGAALELAPRASRDSL